MSMQDQFNEAFEQGMKMNANQSGACTPHHWAEVIKAWADGKMIQYNDLVLGEENVWIDYRYFNTMPNFDSPELLWRIKPEQKTGWIAIDRHGITTHVYDTKEKCLNIVNENEIIACIHITYTEGEGL